MPRMGLIMPIMGIKGSVRIPHSSRGRAASESRAVRSGIAGALFTATQQRLLSLLFGQPARSFLASELIRLTGSGSGAVQRELKRLVSSGLITVTRLGRQKHHQANPDSPVFPELLGLVRKTVGLAEPIREALEPLVDRIKLALIYGSVAKGVDGADSDIDLLVVGNEVMLEDLYSVLSPVEAALDRQVSPTLYTEQEFAERKVAGSAFLKRVLEGETLLLVGTLDEPPAA